MSSDLLTTFNYETYKEIPIAGTEDWVEVARLGDSGGSYDWTDFNVFYSPAARRYFWRGDSGCSCNSWKDGIGGTSDFEDGDRDALLRAWEAFAKEREYSIHVSDYMSGVSEIRGFKVPA